MSKITTTMIAERLGGPPKTWTFFGQCFDAGRSNLTCAILQQPSGYLFTLKPADGSPGRKYVGFEAIPYFKYRHPELYRRLNVGVAFLEMRNDGFDLQERWREFERADRMATRVFRCRLILSWVQAGLGRKGICALKSRPGAMQEA